MHSNSLHTRKRGAQLGIICGSSAGFDLPSGDTVEPDVSFISTERQAASPAPERGQFLRAVPNLVVEVLSPSTASYDRVEKKLVYERNGVDEYWIVDSEEKSVTVFVLRGDRYDSGATYHHGRVPSAALPTLALLVEQIFETQITPLEHTMNTGVSCHLSMWRKNPSAPATPIARSVEGLHPTRRSA